jgi:hypothetical protein
MRAMCDCVQRLSLPSGWPTTALFCSWDWRSSCSC